MQVETPPAAIAAPRTLVPAIAWIMPSLAYYGRQIRDCTNKASKNAQHFSASARVKESRN
jgi:hypothetical protein